MGLGGELITAQNDRDFSSGNIGNWLLTTDGTPLSTLAYNTDAIGGGDDKQALITFDDDGGATVAYAYLSYTDCPVAEDTLYRVCTKVYVPAGNTKKIVVVQVYAFAGADPATKTVTLVGDTWTEVCLYSHIAADITGLFRIGFSGTPTNGDLIYFDDVSVKPVLVGGLRCLSMSLST